MNFRFFSQIGDEYFCYITECKDPKACTILLRGASKDVLMETERNLQDALHVARNIMLNPKLVPGGGAVEMAVSHVCIHFYSRISSIIITVFTVMLLFYFTSVHNL